MVSPGAMIVFGLGLLLVSRLHSASKKENPTGVLRDAPLLVQRLLGARRDRVQVDDIIVGAVGLLWVFGGAGLVATGQATDSPAFAAVEAVLVVCFLAGGLLAAAIWMRREYGN